MPGEKIRDETLSLYCTLNIDASYINDVFSKGGGGGGGGEGRYTADSSMQVVFTTSHIGYL